MSHQRTAPTRRSAWIAALVLLAAILPWAAAGLLASWALCVRSGPKPEPIPAGLRPLERHVVAADGLHLNAWEFAGADPCILYLHGNDGQRSRSLQAVQLHLGRCLLVPSLRAHGDSDGKVNDVGFSARLDVEAWFDLLAREHPGHPILIHGTSMGAAAAIFAAKALGERPAGYLLEVPYDTLDHAIAVRTAMRLPKPLDWLARATLHLFGRLWLPVEPEAIAPLAHAHEIPPSVPVLVLAGSLDRHAPPEQVRAVAAAIPQAKLVVFEGGGHGRFWQSYRAQYLEEVGRMVEVTSRQR